MSIADLIKSLEALNFGIVPAVIIAPPILAILFGLFVKKRTSGENPWRYAYSVILYWSCLPGVLAAVLTAYALFFIRQSLLQVNLVLYFLPIIGMIATLVVVKRNVDWDRLPGVDRLFAFITLIAVSMIIALAILKTRIWVFFGGSIIMLLVIAGVCYLVLKLSFNKLVKSKNDKGPRRYV